MTYRNPKLLAAVRTLPCVECGAHGTQAAHSNLAEHGKGVSEKASDAAIMALCPGCHMDLDNGHDLSREERRAMIYRAVSNTLISMIERGILIVQKG